MNAPATDRCLDLQVLAAFVEGSLEKKDLERVTAHVSRCRTCRIIVGRAAAVDEADDVPAIPLWKLGLAAGLVLAVVGALLFVWALRRRPDPIGTMASVAPALARGVEPRLTGGFRWAPYRNVMGGGAGQSSDELVARGVAGRVLRDLREDDSAEALHAKAVADLLRDDPGPAVALLRAAAARAPNDARVWNDLAAALYVHAQDGAELREALADARRAIRLDPRLIEAYFNVALILERIGTKAEIRSAWNDYLRHDNASGWAEEAKNRLALYQEKR